MPLVQLWPYPLIIGDFFPSQYILLTTEALSEWPPESLWSAFTFSSDGTSLLNVLDIAYYDVSPMIQAGESVMSMELTSSPVDRELKVIRVQLTHANVDAPNILNIREFVISELDKITAQQFTSTSETPVDIELLYLDDVPLNPVATFLVYTEEAETVEFEGPFNMEVINAPPYVVSKQNCRLREKATMKLKILVEIPLPSRFSKRMLKNPTLATLSDVNKQVEERLKQFGGSQLIDGIVIDKFDVTQSPIIWRGFVNLNLFKLLQKYMQFNWDDPVKAFNDYFSHQFPFFTKAVSVVKTKASCNLLTLS